MKITRTIAVTATAVWVAAATANAQTTNTTETQTNSDGTTSSTTTVDEAPTTAPIQPVPGDLTPPPPAPVVNNTVIVPIDEPPVMNQRGAYVPPSRIGFSLMAGGGVQDFTGSTIRDMTGTAGFWDVRAGVGTRSVVGLEAAYVGAAQSITALGLESDAKLLANGVEGDVRVHAPLAYQGTLLEPYAFGGVGWQRYSIVSTPIATASLTNNDDVVTVPMGAGFAAGYRGLLADLRFTYRMVERSNLLAPSGGGSLSNWNLGAHLGYEF
jgi:hypothetical protein